MGIANGLVRPKDIAEAIPGLTKRVLHQQLKELEFYEMISRITYPEIPPRVEYSLMENGKIILPILNEVNEWGLSFVPEFKKIRDTKIQ